MAELKLVAAVDGLEDGVMMVVGQGAGFTKSSFQQRVEADDVDVDIVVV